MMYKMPQRLQVLNNHLLRSQFSTSSQPQLPYRVEKCKDRSIILHPLKEHKYSLIWLHGLGDSAYGFVDIFLDTRFNIVPNNCKVVLLTAPERAVTMNDGFVMTSWYDIKDLRRNNVKSLDDLLDKYSQEELLESVGIVSDVIDQETKLLDNNSKKVFIGGFSQGCALSIATFVMQEKLLGGVVGLSGQNALKFKFEDVKHLEEKKKTPMFLYHGEADGMINHKVAMMTYKEFNDRGFNIDFETEPNVEHSLSERELQKLSKFFHGLMK